MRRKARPELDVLTGKDLSDSEADECCNDALQLVEAMRADGWRPPRAFSALMNAACMMFTQGDAVGQRKMRAAVRALMAELERTDA